jgi:hypothetical protein
MFKYLNPICMFKSLKRTYGHELVGGLFGRGHVLGVHLGGDRLAQLRSRDGEGLGQGTQGLRGRGGGRRRRSVRRREGGKGRREG